MRQQRTISRLAWWQIALGILTAATLCRGSDEHPRGNINDPTLPTPPIWNALRAAFGGEGLVEASLGALQGTSGQTQEFDYVVVGGGTAGNVVGTRLAEAGFKVAIVEAGAFHELSKPLLSTIPGLDFLFIGSNPLSTYLPADWAFLTTPQRGANNRRFKITQGKCVGGSSALNFMLYHRGPAGFYDKWAEDVGDGSYKFDNFNEYYKRSVNFTPPQAATRKVHDYYYTDDFFPTTQGGPVQVGYSNSLSAWSTYLGMALEGLGLNRTASFDRGELNGYHYAQTTIRSSDATRSTSSEYIYKARNKELSNLKIFTNTNALKITFDENGKATGVDVSTFGVEYHLKARNEVVVSAGAFKSPQLLMLSGIGPPETLQQFHIPVISALKGVGQNMWDHIFFGPTFPVSIPTGSSLLWNPLYLAGTIASYVTSRTGLLSSGIVDLLAWEKIPSRYRDAFSEETQKALQYFGDDWPELEFIATNGYVGDMSAPVLSQPLDGKNYAGILGALVAPLSRGNITIRSTSAFDQPIISPNWLTDKADEEVVIAMFKRMREVFKVPKLASALDGSEFFPGDQVQTDADILQFIRTTLMTVWHPSCTNKMGKDDDPMAVIDSDARVFGVKGLRVVDASSFPRLIPGHPSATVYALAEKIAERIIQTEGHGPSE